MRRVIRKRIRRREGGIDLAADLNAVIVVNDGRTSVPEDAPAAEGSGPEDEPPRPGTSTPREEEERNEP